MSLIRCEECNSEISDKAMVCPKCGAPLNKASKKLNEDKLRLTSIVVWIVFLIGLLLLWLGISVMLPDLKYHQFTYTPPYTDHETGVLFKLFLGAIMIGVSIGVNLLIIRRMKQNQ